MAGVLTRLAALGPVVALVAAACGAESSLDAESLVAGLPAAVVPAAPGVVADVDCPEPEPEVVAQSLTCTATLAGAPITVDIDVDEEGVAAAEVREPLLDLDEVAATVASRLTDDLGVVVEVECPGVVVVIAVGRQISCTGFAGGNPRGLVVEIVDDDGSWRVTFADATGS